MSMPSQHEMYEALLERDPRYDGSFVVGVKTTGIFCRPTCVARKPRRENVEFFSGSINALHAGYRPCKRCQPMDVHRKPPPWVVKLRDIADRLPTTRLGDQELRAMGIEPTRARRYFKSNYGLTFAAYHRARRMGMALAEIRQGRSPDQVALRHGFESTSGFRSAFVRAFGYPPGRSRDLRTLSARWFDTPLGAMVGVASDEGLHLLEFVEREALERELAALRAKFCAAIVPGVNSCLRGLERELSEYLQGSRTVFSIPLAAKGSSFQQDVWQALQTIPFGTTWSYAELARAVGRPGAVRAVGQANGANPIALVVPCHRVIASDGSLGGYAGKVWRKQWLLDHEARVISAGSNGVPGDLACAVG